VIVVLCVILIWNKTLKAEVKSKTRELQQARDRLEERVAARTDELAEVNQVLQREMDERVEMARDLLHISGNERARIGRELHDSIGQEMVGITFLSRAAQEGLSATDPDMAKRVGTIADHVERVIVGMKRIVRGLLPVDIMDKGLVVALGLLAREVEDLYGISCRFECDDDEACRVSDNALASNIYRIAQECVGNAAKHAGASEVVVRLLNERGMGILSVFDNGCGITLKEGHSGMGLKIIRYRAQLARGSISIQSNCDKGTTVVCRFDPSVSLHSEEIV
jgi:signal transduction histidine kinase